MTVSSRRTSSSSSLSSLSSSRTTYSLVGLLQLLVVWTTVIVPFSSSSSSLVFVSGAALGKRRHDTPEQRPIRVINQSRRRVDVLWMNKFTTDGIITYHSNSEDGIGYPYGGDTSINSYIGHEFQVKEMPSKKTNQCLGPNNTCRTAYFAVNSEENQVVTIHPDFTITHVDNRRRAQTQAKDIMKNCDDLLLVVEVVEGDDDTVAVDKSQQQQRLDEYIQCLQSQVDNVIDDKSTEYEFESKLRTNMASQLSHYACHPHTNVTSSGELYNRTWNYRPTPESRTKEYQLQVLHEHEDSSWIVQLPNFVSVQECSALQESKELLPGRTGEFQQQQTKDNEEDDNDDDNTNQQQQQEDSATATISWNVLHTSTKNSLVLQAWTAKIYSLAQALLHIPQLPMSPAFPSHDLMTWHTTQPYYVKEDGDDAVVGGGESTTDEAGTCQEGSGNKEGSEGQECTAAAAGAVGSTTTTTLNDTASTATAIRKAPLVSGTLEPTSTTVNFEQRMGTLFIFCPLEDTKEEDKSKVSKQQLRPWQVSKSTTATATTEGGGSIVFDKSPIERDEDNNVDHFVTSGGGSGALRFPYADVHVNPKPYLAVFVTHPSKEYDQPSENGYTKEYHYCPNAQIMTHEFYNQQQQQP